MSIFLTETDTRHSLLHKRKLFRDKIQTRLTSNSSKLMGASRDEPIDVEGQFSQGASDVPILREDDDDHDAINLADIPMANETVTDSELTNRRPKRPRSGNRGRGGGGAGEGHYDESDVEVVGDSNSSADELFEDDIESEEDDAAHGQRPPKRRKDMAAAAPGNTAEQDDKKKMAMDISYEGFAIYGRVLCLVVKMRGDGTAKGGSSAVPSGHRAQPTRPGGQAMMENWIASTQVPEEAAEDADA